MFGTGQEASSADTIPFILKDIEKEHQEDDFLSSEMYVEAVLREVRPTFSTSQLGKRAIRCGFSSAYEKRSLITFFLE